MRTDVIQRKAQLLIRNLGIDTWPVDVKDVAGKLDLDIIETRLPDDTSGVLEKTTKGNSTIFVNEQHAPVRKRFTIAHEIGHHLLSPKEGIYVDRQIFFRNGRSHEAVSNDEMAANAFAAELLMPKQLVKSALSKFAQNGYIDSDGDLVTKLANDFEVSTTAMSIRLQNMGLSF